MDLCRQQLGGRRHHYCEHAELGYVLHSLHVICYITFATESFVKEKLFWKEPMAQFGPIVHLSGYDF